MRPFWGKCDLLIFRRAIQEDSIGQLPQNGITGNLESHLQHMTGSDMGSGQAAQESIQSCLEKILSMEPVKLDIPPPR